MQFSLDMKDWLLQVDFSDDTFIWKKERSTEAVPIGMVRKTLARMLKFGNLEIFYAWKKNYGRGFYALDDE